MRNVRPYKASHKNHIGPCSIFRTEMNSLRICYFGVTNSEFENGIEIPSDFDTELNSENKRQMTFCSHFSTNFRVAVKQLILLRFYSFRNLEHRFHYGMECIPFNGINLVRNVEQPRLTKKYL